MRSIVIAVCVLLASPAQAEDAAGTKWLDCKVGQGGRASAQDVYLDVVKALTKGATVDLTALRLDDCALFRIAATAGYAAAASVMEDMDARRDDKVVTQLRARIEVEGFDLAKAPFTVTPNEEGVGPMLTVATRTDMRLRLEVKTVSIDGRWYLWQMPVIAGNDEVLVKRYGVLMRELDKRLGKRTGAAAIAVMDAWQKQRAAELEKLALAAAATASNAPRDARKALETKYPEPDVRKRIANLGLGSSGVTGIPACDDFLERMWRCIEAMPPEIKPAITQAMTQATEAWKTAADGAPEVHAALEMGCGQAAQSVAGSMSPMCPGVW